MCARACVRACGTRVCVRACVRVRECSCGPGRARGRQPLRLTACSAAQRCKYDTCNCEDSEDCLCAALSSYARACAAQGLTLWGWRELVCSECRPRGRPGLCRAGPGLGQGEGPPPAGAPGSAWAVWGLLRRPGVCLGALGSARADPGLGRRGAGGGSARRVLALWPQPVLPEGRRVQQRLRCPGVPGTLAFAEQASAPPGWRRGSGTAGGSEPGSPPGPSRGPSLCRQGRGLLPQVTDLPVQPDHLPADLPLALRAGHALPRGLRARGRLRLPGPHLPGREEPLRAPGPVFLLPPWPLPGGGGGGSEAGGALVGVRAGTEGLGEPAAPPGPTEPRGLRPPTAPLTSPSLTASAGTGGCSACRSCCSARVSGRRPGWGRSPRPAAAELRWPLRPTGCAAPKVHVDCSNLTALAIRNPRPVSCQTLAAGYVRAGAGRVPGRGRRAPRWPCRPGARC